MIAKDQLLQAFSHYLDSAEAEATVQGTATEIDLHTLFTELAALRNEVKTESRQFKGALEDFRQVLTTLQTTHTTLSTALERSAQEHRKQGQEALRSVLLGVLEIYDRMAAGVEILRHYQPSIWSGKQQTAFIESLLEGQNMTLRRVEQLLEHHRVYAITTLGQPLDPHCMRAIETACDPRYADGCVVEELRKGFRWEEAVLRLAEVRVNKY